MGGVQGHTHCDHVQYKVQCIDGVERTFVHICMSVRSKGPIDLEHFRNMAQLDADKTEEKLMQRYVLSK